jgi:hypothetical protein
MVAGKCYLWAGKLFFNMARPEGLFGPLALNPFGDAASRRSARLRRLSNQLSGVGGLKPSRHNVKKGGLYAQPPF